MASIIASGDWWRLEDDGTLYIYCVGDMPNYTSSTVPWRNYRTQITSASIANGVTSIGNDAFYGCSALTSVTIPGSVTSIGQYAFYNCSGLTSIMIPDSVTSIGDSAFNGCSALTSITIPGGVTSIGNEAFSNCRELLSIQVDNGNTAFSSKDGVLLNKDRTTFLCYPAGKTDSSYQIPNSVTSIGGSAFNGCSALTSITIPGGVTSIGRAAFYKCSGLTSVTIPNGVTSIGQSTFYNCSGLTSITIPSGVTSIGNYAFYNCSGLTDVYYSGTEAQWNAINISGNNTPLTSATIHYNYTPPVPTYTVTFDANGGTGNMSAQTFTGGTAQELTANAFTRTGYMFGGWNTAADGSGTAYADGASYTANADITLYAQWTQVVLSSIAVTTPPAKTAYTAGETFDPAGMVVTATYSDGTTATVSGYSASPSGALTTSDTAITVSYTEGGVTATATVAITVAESWWRIENGDTLRISCVGDMPDYETAYGRPPPWYDYREQITSAVMENGVTSIGGSAFSRCANLTSVTIPSGITSIGESAFYGCAALSGVTIPSGVTSIGNNAFRDCESITSITIPGSVTDIGVCAFFGSGLRSVTVPGSVGSVSSMAFRYCPLSSVTIQNGVASIDYSAFYQCGSLLSIAIPVSVTEIKQYAFLDCDNLADVYYGGTESQWNAITIGSDNNALTSATIHYSEPAPEPEPEPVAAGLINYTGRSKVIRRLCASVNVLYAARPRFFIDGDGYISIDYGGDSE